MTDEEPERLDLDEPEGRLAVLKTLGDNTRYAIYLELARSPRPLATGEIADALALHPNTVRPHLERMRELALVELGLRNRGVGRPQHVYSIAPDAPSLGLEPPSSPILARMLAAVCSSAGVTADEAAEVGREQGQDDGRRRPHHRAAESSSSEVQGCAAALMVELERLGFDPALVEDKVGITIAFAHCPFYEVAQLHPQLVCHLHRGMVEGFVDQVGGAMVDGFNTLIDRHPCRVDLVAR